MQYNKYYNIFVNMELNLLNKNISKEIDNPLEVSKREFWEFYLRLLLNNNNTIITDREVQVLSYLLLEPPNEYLSRRGLGKEIGDLLKISVQHVYIIKQKLIDKGLLKEVNKNITFHPSIAAFHRFIYNTEKELITFKFPFKICQ